MRGGGREGREKRRTILACSTVYININYVQ